MIKRYERVSLKANKYSLSVQMLLSYDQTKKLILIVIKYFQYVRIIYYSYNAKNNSFFNKQ